MWEKGKKMWRFERAAEWKTIRWCQYQREIEKDEEREREREGESKSKRARKGGMRMGWSGRTG